MRPRLFFIAALAFALLAMLPLGLVSSWFPGLAAREADGSLWLGVLKEAQFGGVPLGDVNARLNVLPLLIGRARLSLSRDGDADAFSGAVGVSRHGFAVDDLTGRLRTGALFAPLTPRSTRRRQRPFHRTAAASAEGNVRAALGRGRRHDAARASAAAPAATRRAAVPMVSHRAEQVNPDRGDGGWRTTYVALPIPPRSRAYRRRLAPAAGYAADRGTSTGRFTIGRKPRRSVLAARLIGARTVFRPPRTTCGAAKQRRPSDEALLAAGALRRHLRHRLGAAQRSRSVRRPRPLWPLPPAQVPSSEIVPPTVTATTAPVETATIAPADFAPHRRAPTTHPACNRH